MINFHFRLSEMREDLILLIHQISICFVCSVMTLIYCSNEFGICRPHPMLYYFKDDWQETKFRRDPVSLIFNVTHILVVLVLQMLIEMKKRRMKVETTKAEETAAAANRNLENAMMKLTLQEIVQSEQDHQHQNPKDVNIGQTEEMVVEDEDVGKVTSSKNALKVARAVSLFAILPASLYSILFSLENIGGWRPHGAAACSMISFGIVVPSVLFFYNLKMRKFAINYLKNKVQKWKCKSRSSKIVPIF